MHNADLIVIGAGPAGMSAARRAAALGLSVLILDEQPAAGGQIYRNVDRASAARNDILGKDYTHGRTLTEGCITKTSPILWARWFGRSKMAPAWLSPRMAKVR